MQTSRIFNLVVEEFGVLLRRAIVCFCPRDKGLQCSELSNLKFIATESIVNCENSFPGPSGV
jgi:hypothetical protein